jgi:two-component system LytT family response regulator
VIRTLIVDDEPLAREGLRLRLRDEPDVEVVGEAADVPAAARAIAELRPDLVLLDVQMPGGDGFDALERAAGVHLPLVVFCTAHDEHALRAFEVHALDYLMKPVSSARLQEALQRVRRGMGRPEDPARLHALLAARGAPRRLLVQQGSRWVALPEAEIRWAKAAANYVRIFARGSEFLLRSTFRSLVARLHPEGFVRVHRSVLVAVDAVREVRPRPAGDQEVVLEDGMALPVGRAFRRRLLLALGRRR